MEDGLMKKNEPASLSTLLETYFVNYLISQRQASPHTIASYRDTFRLLLKYAQSKLNKTPSSLGIDDLDAPFIRAFLNDLEATRNISARSRNQRLAAIHSMFKFAATEIPEKSDIIARVLAIPQKRFQRSIVCYLTSEESEVLLNVVNRTKPLGRRDYTLLLLAIQTGLRASELVKLKQQDINIGSVSYVRCFGKGRKERTVPLNKQTARVIRSWISECAGTNNDYLFTSARGNPLSIDGLQYIVSKYASQAQYSCPSLAKKNISPHVLRHTTAMRLLQSGVDLSVIALWLGHESIDTTQMYIEADLAMKERALAKTASPNIKSSRFHPSDQLLEFLDSL
jgi:integrase/recombinase XerD